MLPVGAVVRIWMGGGTVEAGGVLKEVSRRWWDADIIALTDQSYTYEVRWRWCDLTEVLELHPDWQAARHVNSWLLVSSPLLPKLTTSVEKEGGDEHSSFIAVVRHVSDTHNSFCIDRIVLPFDPEWIATIDAPWKERPAPLSFVQARNAFLLALKVHLVPEFQAMGLAGCVTYAFSWHPAKHDTELSRAFQALIGMEDISIWQELFHHLEICALVSGIPPSAFNEAKATTAAAEFLHE